MYYNCFRFSQSWLFRWQSSFAFLFRIAVRCSEVLKEHNIFGVTELLQVDADVMQWKKMCHLYTMFWGNFSNHTILYNTHALSLQHLCIRLNQFSHAEDERSMFLWKVGTFNHYARQKPKTRPLFGE